jgi:hypothetical protein
MARKIEPSDKGKDPDYLRMMVMAQPQTCGCPCACCATGRCGGHGGQDGPMSPHGEQLFHREPERVAAEALRRRHEVITGALLPQARELAASLAQANQRGAVGPGELEILSTLQCWVLQLQIEQDELRLALAPPDLEPRAP